MDYDDDIDQNEGETLSFVTDGDGRRLDVWLADRSGLSRSRVQSLIGDGRVELDGVRAQAKVKPQEGQTVIVTLPPPAPAEPEPEDIPLDIIYEDADVIVVNKPAGLVVHPAPGHDRGTLVNALLFHCHDLRGIGGVMRPGIVHRLDMDTTGLIVACKNEGSLQSLASQFQSGRTSKEYLALVHGDPGRISGTIRTTIGRDPADRKRMAANPPSGKSAVTHYRVEEHLGRTTLLRVRIETGHTPDTRPYGAYRAADSRRHALRQTLARRTASRLPQAADASRRRIRVRPSSRWTPHDFLRPRSDRHGRDDRAVQEQYSGGSVRQIGDEP